MIKVEDALRVILQNTKIKNISEEVYIDEIVNRISFEDVKSNVEFPSFNRSAMDGYAVIFGNNKKQFRIVDNIDDFTKGCCIRINTGFPIPDAADSIVEIEHTKSENGQLYLDIDLEKNRNFTYKATEVKIGDILVKKGERISIRKAALLAYCGIVRAKVYQKPIVGFITTGDEVVFPGDEIPKNKVYNANYFILKELLKKWGAQPIYFGHIEDKKEEIKEKLSYAVKRCDIVLTTGGVSKGSRDYTKEILNEMEAEILFLQTTIKPGKPAAFGKIDDKLIFALPGWPAALYTTAYVYLKVLIQKMSGLSGYKNSMYLCKLAENMHSKKGKDYFNRVFLSYEDNEFHCKSAGSQKTDNYYSVAKADGLLEIDESKGDVEKGSRLYFLPFDD